MDIWNDLFNELERHRVSTSIIGDYLRVYEGECNALIEAIFSSSSFEFAEKHFDALHAIQVKLAIVKYKFEFPMNARLQDFIYHLDRDDVFSRKYWYGEFRRGVKWPGE